MSVKQTESKITALYERLSRDDDNAGDTTSGWAPRPSPPTGSCCGRPLTGPWSAGRRTWRPF